jgi:RNA polymerase sigma-70 factor (ECF subfamily)
LWGLLLVIALNKVRQAAVFHRAARRDVRKTSSTEDVSNLGFLVSGEGDDEQALAVLQMVIAELVQKLPPAKQEMIRMRIDGHEVDEIATQTQRSKRTVERTLQEFREQLAKALEMNIEGEGEHVRPGDES